MVAAGMAADLATRTIRTMSVVSGVVTRRPPWNSPAMPSRSSIAAIRGPPLSQLWRRHRRRSRLLKMRCPADIRYGTAWRLG